MVVEVAFVGVMMLFVAIWVFAMYGSTSHMNRAEIEEQMDEFARKYIETHDPEIPAEIYKLARELEKLEKTSSD
jgi:hypothetical protein